VEPAAVGLILDSSVLIAGERRGRTGREILEQFRAAYGEIEIGLSVIMIVELTHGQRAGNSAFGVATASVRPFSQIPGLTVVAS
jgi:hypothetical protein